MTIEWQYFDIYGILADTYLHTAEIPGTVFKSVTKFNPVGKKHIRIVYNIFNLIGDIAGIYELLASLMGYFVCKLTYYNFVLTAIKKYFLIKSKHSHIFDEKKFKKKNANEKELKKGIEKYLCPRVTDLIEDQSLKHYIVKFHRKMSLSNF